MFLDQISRPPGLGHVCVNYRRLRGSVAFPLSGSVVHHEDVLVKIGQIEQNLALVDIAKSTAPAALKA